MDESYIKQAFRGLLNESDVDSLPTLYQAFKRGCQTGETDAYNSTYAKIVEANSQRRSIRQLLMDAFDIEVGYKTKLRYDMDISIIDCIDDYVANIVRLTKEQAEEYGLHGDASNWLLYVPVRKFESIVDTPVYIERYCENGATYAHSDSIRALLSLVEDYCYDREAKL
jgi:hypothetical protein